MLPEPATTLLDRHFLDRNPHALVIRGRTTREVDLDRLRQAVVSRPSTTQAVDVRLIRSTPPTAVAA
jgi:hypothetical protein